MQRCQEGTKTFFTSWKKICGVAIGVMNRPIDSERKKRDKFPNHSGGGKGKIFSFTLIERSNCGGESSNSRVKKK